MWNQLNMVLSASEDLGGRFETVVSFCLDITRQCISEFERVYINLTVL